MKKTETEINLNNPIRILVPKSILDKVTNYIIQWENKSVPGLIEFLFQDDILGYEIRCAIVKLGFLENLIIDKVYHLIYDEDNKTDITIEMYGYYENNLTLIITNQIGSKTMITDSRSVTKLNEVLDWIIDKTKKFDEFLDDIIFASNYVNGTNKD